MSLGRYRTSAWVRDSAHSDIMPGAFAYCAVFKTFRTLEIIKYQVGVVAVIDTRTTVKGKGKHHPVFFPMYRDLFQILSELVNASLQPWNIHYPNQLQEKHNRGVDQPE